MNLRTITTIELSSVCSLACKYCINRLMPLYGRKSEIMDEETFERSLYWLKKLCKFGSQQEINLNGNGESTLDTDLISRIRRVKDIVGDRQVGMSTNGTHITYDLAVKLRDIGVLNLSISPHSCFHARRAVMEMMKAGLKVTLNMGPIGMSHNWAGQLEPENSIEMGFTVKCDPLAEGRGYIQSHGGLSPCCYDFRGLGQFGTVFDDDLLIRPIKAYELCKSCHQQIPADIRAEVGA
jgi:hypothetical protein